MTIKRFVVFSLALHLAFFLGIRLIPAPHVKKAREFITSLVSPEQLNAPEKRVKPVPNLIPLPRISPSPRRLPPSKKIAPSRPPLRERPEWLEKPVVPGEGKEVGKALPEGKYPRPDEKARDSETRERGTGDRGGGTEHSKPGFSTRDALFDRRTIEEIARNDTGRGGGKERKRDDSITFDTEDYRYAGYMRNLRQKIESIWVYPPEAAARGLYGDLKIRFSIRKDGRLGAVELVRTSGYKMLDDAAISALKDGEPYWPLPDSWGKDLYTIEGHFIYSLYGYHLR